MVNAQNWLDNNIPLNQRVNIRKLLICSASQREEHECYLGDELRYVYEDITSQYYLDVNLTGSLDLSTFSNLEEIVVEGFFIERLVLTNCQQLIEIHASDNLLREIIWPIQAPGLERIHLINNNLFPQNLSCFSRFLNLKHLFIGTNDEDRIRQGIYNRWCGSLFYLTTLVRLEELDINASDISSGLEYLATKNLLHFTFGSKGRAEAGVNQLKNALKNIFNFEEGDAGIDKWMEEWAADDDFGSNPEKIWDIRNWQRGQLRAQVVVVPQILN